MAGRRALEAEVSGGTIPLERARRIQNTNVQIVQLYQILIILYLFDIDIFEAGHEG